MSTWDVDAVRETATRCSSVDQLDAVVAQCRACPRLVQWREQVARDKRRAFADQQYWGRPVPGLGPADAAILLVGLAPAAHGGNRTGRIFTGDRSGDFLFASLHRVGLANQAQSRDIGDGLRLVGTRITAAVHCAPPANAPSAHEQTTCREWLKREMDLLSPSLRVVVALGGLAWSAVLDTVQSLGTAVRPRPRFVHGAQRDLGPLVLLGTYHPSQQNTFTGRLTAQMLDDVLTRATALAAHPPSPA